MRMLDVESRLPILEIDGVEQDLDPKMVLVVRNNWNRSNLVVLKISTGGKDHEVTVLASALKRAIDNATNCQIP